VRVHFVIGRTLRPSLASFAKKIAVAADFVGAKRFAEFRSGIFFPLFF
jgi:hypothetical protein